MVLDIEPVDIAIDTVKAYTMVKGKQMPVKNDTLFTRPKVKDPDYITDIRNREAGLITLVGRDTTLRDFYYYYKGPEAPVREVKNRHENLEEMPDSNFAAYEGKYIYEIKFSNKGGLVMPLIIRFVYHDGTEDIERIGAYIWRKNEKEVVKTFLKDKKVIAIQQDPYRETADINEKNNSWNMAAEPGKFELFKARNGPGRGQSKGENPMQKNLKK